MYTTALLQLPLVRETERKMIKTPEDTFLICKDLGSLAQEAFHVLTLNAKNMLISRQMVTLGLLDASLVHPREVFREAIGMNAAALILTHNHPSGDTAPSTQDVRITNQLITAGEIIDIKVLDHVIIGRESESCKGFLSMREDGICKF